MIRVVKKEWEEIEEGYTFELEDGDRVFIRDSEYNKIQIHTSSNNKKLKAVVNEHEDDFEEPVEYLGFEPVS